MFTHYRTASLLLLLAFQISICAQWPEPSQQTDPANELWRERARNITEDLIVDGQKLPPLRRAVLRARLAERWWRDDPRRAAGWLTMAVSQCQTLIPMGQQQLLDRSNKQQPPENSSRFPARDG